MNKGESIHKKLILIALPGLILLLVASVGSSVNAISQVGENSTSSEIYANDGISANQTSSVHLDADYADSSVGGNAGGDSNEPAIAAPSGLNANLGMATLIAPKGIIGAKNPKYIWNAVAESTRYTLKVKDPSGKSTMNQYDADSVTVNSICEAISPVSLVPGDYVWWVRTGNEVGDGPWSSAMRFTVSGKPPGKANPMAPAGLISTTTPIFTWSVAPGSTEYHLQIDSVDSDSGEVIGAVIDASYPAEEVTSGYKCKLFSPMSLPSDDIDFTWKVQASNDFGKSSWSESKWFEVICPTKKIKEHLAKDKKASFSIIKEPQSPGSQSAIKPPSKTKGTKA